VDNPSFFQDPRRDIPVTTAALLTNAEYGFGSAHPGGVNAVFADGSVHHVVYSINPVLFNELGNKADGFPLQNNGNSF
jgi:prepilin-type processing-associated H-X9-DG protein